MAQKGWRGWLEQIGWAERVFAVLLVLALTGLPGRLGDGVWLATGVPARAPAVATATSRPG